jgi:hypothetical protein
MDSCKELIMQQRQQQQINYQMAKKSSLILRF